MGINRYFKNPILTKDDVPFTVNSIFNPGAVKYKGKYIFFVESRCRLVDHHLVIAESRDGYNFKVSSKPILTPEDHIDCYDYVKWGIEDARITQIENKFYLAYTGYSQISAISNFG